MSDTLSPKMSLEDVQVHIRTTDANPNIGRTHQVVLKNGPRTYRVATIFEIMDPNKDTLHHLSLQLDSCDKSKAGWKLKPEKRIRLEGENPDEISALAAFLATALSFPGLGGALLRPSPRLAIPQHFRSEPIEQGEDLPIRATGQGLLGQFSVVRFGTVEPVRGRDSRSPR